MNLKDISVRIIRRACCVFTLLYIFLFAVSAGFDLTQGNSYRQGFIILLTAVIFAVAQEIFYIGKLPKAVAVPIHYIAVLIPLFILYNSTGKFPQMTPAYFISIIVVYSIVYAAIYGGVVLMHLSAKKKRTTGKTKKVPNKSENKDTATSVDKSKKTEYQSRFS